MEMAILNEQDAQICYDIATVAYVSRPEYILNSSGIWDDRRCISTRHRSIDIDDDLDIARFLMEKSQNDR